MAFADHVARLDRNVRTMLGGEPVVYRPGGGAPAVPVTGIFDERYVLQADQTAGVCATAPAVFLDIADLPTDPEIDDPTLTIRGAEYRVDHPETAGMGSVVLVLRKVI